MAQEITRPAHLKPTGNAFCPGCMHSMAMKLVMQSLEELGVADRSIFVAGVGCLGNGAAWINMDLISAAHGRAPAVATGVKRSKPDSIVLTYQGDGDLAGIGLSEIISAANRGEKFTTIFINNSTYGMTGGQMAPTTLVGMKATTAPKGRNPETEGYPLDMCDILSRLRSPSYIARCALDNPADIRKAKAAIKKAFQYQIDGKAFSLVELLSNCVTNWNMGPVESLKFIENSTSKVFPLGVYRDVNEGV